VSDGLVPPPPDAPDSGDGAPYEHDTAVVDAGAVLGPGVKVWHFSHVCAEARIGNDSRLGQGVYVGPAVRIGRGCKIQNHVSIYEGVELADEVFVGPSAVFTNVRTPRAHVSRRDEFLATHVGRRSTIGANATIVCGVRVGERAFVAAGAIVTHDVAPGVLVAGCPARPIGWVCDCGERLPDPSPTTTCARCRRRWRHSDDGGVESLEGGV
jgi:UDP-2-acetamido-3-amino-2,3-dideoxy-glucuronate N-acetyltransferase